MLILAAYSAFVFSVIAASVVTWCWIAVRLWNGRPLIHAEPGELVPWGLADCFLFFVLFLLLGIAAATGVAAIRHTAKVPAVPSPVEPVPAAEVKEAASEPAPVQSDSEDDMPEKNEDETKPDEAKLEEAKPDEAKPAMSIADARLLIGLDSGLKIVVALLIIGAITLRYQPTAVEWGWTTRHLFSDIRAGAGVFLATFLPVMVLQAALVYGLDWKYAHPLIDLAKQSKDPIFFALAGFAAAILAPLFEEFVFRGLLQGWLEKLFSGYASAEQILLGGRTPPAIIQAEFAPDAAAGAAPLQAYFETPSMDSSVMARPDIAAPDAASPGAPSTGLNPLPIIISSIVFSLLHYSHGPAWIPLLLLGYGLGYAYQRTHRLWPGIVAHCLLNSFTMVGLWIQVFGAPDLIKQ